MSGCSCAVERERNGGAPWTGVAPLQHGAAVSTRAPLCLVRLGHWRVGGAAEEMQRLSQGHLLLSQVIWASTKHAAEAASELAASDGRLLVAALALRIPAVHVISSLLNTVFGLLVSWRDHTLLLHIKGSVARCGADASVLTGRCTGGCASRCDSSPAPTVSMHHAPSLTRVPQEV